MPKGISTLQILQDEITEWGKQTFGQRENSVSTLKHLIEEVQEAIENPSLEEYADMFILYCQAAAIDGYDMSDIIRAVEKKHEINKAREWNAPDRDGIVRHKK